LAFGRDVVYLWLMTRSSSWVERPILRLLLLALMGLALASRLALGATLPIASSGDHATAADPLAKLQAAMIMCHTGQGHDPVPRVPQGPLLSDLLLFDQGDNTHALASCLVVAPLVDLRWSAVAFPPIHAASQPPLWRPRRQARGPPPTV
jgi:hypothetical protein